jgi:3-deoxy-D-arabino-heptulosonate 7-phosphate (DAHP) synthase class II
MQEWKKDSWKSKKIVQDVEYEDADALKTSLHKLSTLPPLVSHIEGNY